MLARWLQWMLLAVLFVAVLLAISTGSRPLTGLAVTIGSTVLILAVVSAVVTFATFASVVAFRIFGRQGMGAPLSGFARAFPGEWLALLGLYTVIQPFQSWLMGPDERPAKGAGKPHVLLVHGYFCNRGLWWAFRRCLLAAGYSASTIDLEPPQGSIETFATELESRVAALEAELGEQDRIVVIAHSMGGLVTREMLRRRGAGRISKVVTIGSPHSGTMSAYLGIGACTREMLPGSDFLKRLASAPPPVPIVCLITPTDNFMAPADTPLLAGSRSITLDEMGHLATAFSTRVHAILLEEIAAAAGEAPATSVSPASAA